VFAALIVGVTAVALFWYFVLSDPSGEAVPASGGRYVEAVARGPDRINPLFAAANPTDGDLAALIFSGLVRLGPDGTPQPDLAERWEITSNGQTYIFHLRRGIVWHDGADFTAEDVAFTFKAIADPAFKGDPSLRQLLEGVTVQARDPLTVEFKLQQPFAPFLAYLSVGILPKHLLDGLDANQLFNAPFNARPVGTGPYQFDRRTSDAVQLAANRTFYLGPPLISDFEVRVYADAGAARDALRAGDVDGALLTRDASPEEIDALSKDARFSVHDLTSTSFNAIYVNTRAPLFADPDVRLALSRAINPASVIDDAAGGLGEVAVSAIPRGSWAFTAVAVPTFDPGASATALERAGWSRGADGVRQKSDLRLDITLSTPNDGQHVAIAESVARQWRAVGAAVTVEPIAAGAYVDDYLAARQFQAAVVAIDPGPDPDPYPLWHSTQVAPPGRNLTGFSDPGADDALERARQTTDSARRKELYAQFEETLAAAAPQIPLYAPVSAYVQRVRVRGFADALLFSPASRFSSVRDWYVKTRLKQ